MTAAIRVTADLAPDSAWSSADRLDDRLVEAMEGREVLPALLLDPVDHGVVLGLAALALVQPAGLQDLDVVDARAATLAIS